MKERLSEIPIVEPTTSPAEGLSLPDLAEFEQMDRKALYSLLQRVSMAGWGYGKLTGKELLETALKTKDEAYEALKLTALTLATNAKDWREFHTLATFWSEREKGKPITPIAVDARIGLMQIIENMQNVVIDDGKANSPR